MGRAPCCDKTNVKRGPWSPEEDAALRNYLHRHGTGGNWIALPQKAGLKRCGKSCRLRWLNYLRPDIKHGGFTEEEDNIICTLYRSLGSRWSVIASKLQCRTDNDVKNYWNTKLKKKVMMASAAAAAGQANLAAQQQQPRVPLPLPPTSLTYVMPMEFNPGFNIDQNPIIFNGSANSRYVISPPAPGTAQENSYEYMSWAANSSNCGSGGGGGGEDDIHGGLMMGMSQLEESSPPDLLNWYGFQSRIGGAASYNNYDGSSSSGLPNMGANAIEGKPSHGLYLESLAYL